ncbi:hypothetical protein [Mesoterricola silvestris]|uniref:Uncharacterized protein n=1 Tax=Mesoterricola silvestris TaxID=2927979 RepID=A0AA48K9L4_9BACT|nr:hypothetical protein [Mesoterricola silvestris]BDU73190.1 hypothetical protein METEAL_23640 [Mesoterricola silvestris]
MLPESFAILGAIIGSLGGFYYLFETLAGRTQPNRITWLLWGLFPMVIFVAQRAQGVQGLSWTTFAAGFLPLLIVGVSFFNPKAYWKSEPRDYYLMAAAVLGIILWGLTHNPNLALVFSLLADVLAGIPTVLKAYRHPRSESWIGFTISAIGFGISFLSIQVHSFGTTAFVAYLVIGNASIAALASRGRGHRPT